MAVIRAASAPRFAVPGVEFIALAAPSRGSDELCTWRITVEPRLRSPEPHWLDADEVFMVTSGSVQLQPDGDVLGAGDAAVVPAGTPIQLVNPGTVPAEAFVAIRSGFSATAADGTSIGTPPWAR
jgi:mannose-6-phosphate isomerase-like protein (cupin superfamily)